MYSKEIFLSNINYLCEQKKIKKSELEKEVEISVGYLSRLEKEDDVAPKISLVDAVAQKLEIDIDSLISVKLKDIDSETATVLQFIRKLLDDTHAGVCSWKMDEDTPHGKHKPGIHKRRNSPFEKYYTDNVYYSGMAYSTQLSNGMEVYLLPLVDKNDNTVIELYSQNEDDKLPICTSEKIGGSSLLLNLYHAIIGEQEKEEISSTVKAKMDEYLRM
jgi:transcriptional regulator with XRE-family HTH domain